MTNYSNRKSSSEQECEKAIVPKEEILDFELPSDAAFSGHFGVCPPFHECFCEFSYDVISPYMIYLIVPS